MADLKKVERAAAKRLAELAAAEAEMNDPNRPDFADPGKRARHRYVIDQERAMIERGLAVQRRLA